MSDAPIPRTFSSREFLAVLLVIGILGGLISLSAPTTLAGLIAKAHENASALAAHNLMTALASYEFDHGVFPIGAKPNSSTAAFQVLYDDKLLTDPAEVYLAGPGRVRASLIDGQVKLLSENVAWDYTERSDRTPLSGTDPSSTPLIISTGAGPHTFVNGRNSVTLLEGCTWGKDGLTVGYLDQSVLFIPAASPDASVSLTHDSYLTRGGHYTTVTPEQGPPLPAAIIHSTPSPSPTATAVPTPSSKPSK